MLLMGETRLVTSMLVGEARIAKDLGIACIDQRVVRSGQEPEFEGELNMHRASDENSWQTHERILNRSTTAIQDEDVVGAGRYILSLLLAGILGLAIQYGLRKQGWTATWINAAIFVIIVALVAATG